MNNNLLHVGLICCHANKYASAGLLCQRFYKINLGFDRWGIVYAPSFYRYCCLLLRASMQHSPRPLPRHVTQPCSSLCPRPAQSEHLLLPPHLPHGSTLKTGYSCLLPQRVVMISAKLGMIDSSQPKNYDLKIV